MSKNRGIFTKLFLIFLVIVFIAFVLFSVIFTYLFHIKLYDEYEETYNFYKNQLVTHLSLAEKNNWDDEVVQSTFQLSLSQKDQSIFLYDSNGQLILAPSNSSIAGIELDESIIRDNYAKGMRVDGQLIYVISSPIKFNSEEHSLVMIFHELNHEYRQLVIMIIITLSITIAISGIILWFVSRKITAPLRNMNEVALAFAKGNFSKSVEVQSRDEIGQLGKTFNYMATELASLEQMRRDFIANVSHDLRSPLTSIKGLLVAFLDGTIPKDKKRYYYTIMKSETERLIKLVNDLLDMTQLEAGQIEIKPAAYNLTEQLRIAIVKMEPQLVKHEIDIELVSGDEELYVYADADRIEQVFVNLIQNAIHNSHRKNSINLLINKKENFVNVTVQDFGRGIKEEDLEKIWERFYKTDRGRSKKVGTGIGLSIVKSILDLHNAPIKVESEVNKGTIVTFSLPVAKHELS